MTPPGSGKDFDMLSNGASAPAASPPRIADVDGRWQKRRRHERYWKDLEAILEVRGGLGAFGNGPGASWGPLGCPRELFGPSWGRLGGVLGRLGVVLGGLGAVLGPTWAVLGRVGRVLGRPGRVLSRLGATWGALGPK